MRAMHRKQARDAFDHHRAGVCEGLANKRDPQGRRVLSKVRALHQCAYPFGPCSRLAGAAAAEHQPGGPIAVSRGNRRGKLVVARPDLEIVMEALELLGPERRQESVKTPELD